MMAQQTLSRRSFCQTSLTFGLAASVANLSRAQANDDGWIDAHVHVWTPDTQKYPISSDFKVSDMQPPSFTPEQLFAHCRPEGVARIVLIQMSFYKYDNTYMLDVMEQHPGVFSGVGIVDHRATDLDLRVERLAKRGVRGFRIHSTNDCPVSKWATDDAMRKFWKIAAERNLSVCPLINPGDLEVIDALCTQFPQTRVVIDHFARIGVSGSLEPDRLAALCKLARFKNTHVKTSAFYALGKKAAPYLDLGGMIRQVRDAFGAERLMWASDCPYQVQDPHNYANSIALIRDRLDFLSADERKWMLRGTAEKVFFANA